MAKIQVTVDVNRMRKPIGCEVIAREYRDAARRHWTAVEDYGRGRGSFATVRDTRDEMRRLAAEHRECRTVGADLAGRK